MNRRNPISRIFSGRSPRSSGEEEARQEILRLRQSVDTLSRLNDLAMSMSVAAGPEEAVETLVDRSMRAVNAEQATVKLLGRDKSSALDTQVDVVVSSAEHHSFRVDEGLLGWMLLNNKPLILNDPHNDDRFRGFDWHSSIRSVMCLPLTIKNELIGILTMYNKRDPAGFTEDDQRLLSIISANSAQIIDNVKLVKDKNRMEEQLNLAFQIQTNLLPKSPPTVEGYDIAGKSVPAQSVGGDYFDWIPVDERRLAVCLGDVSGKGMPASLLMANVQATLRGQTLIDATPAERISRSNKLLYQCTDDERFVTLWYGVIDVGAHSLAYCNAGHEHPFVVAADGSTRRLDMGGLALGVFEEFQYIQATVSLFPGDVLAIYSDGVPDAANASEEPFGDARIESLIVEHRDEPAAAVVDAVFQAVDSHAGDTPQFDDLTMVVVKRTG
jgi:sigma-B regulation protein RsbU (phosphoserine phosphatase)